MRRAGIPDATSIRFSRLRRALAAALVCALLGLTTASCGGGSAATAARGGSDHSSRSSRANPVRLTFTPSDGSRDRTPDKGITVRAEGGKIKSVTVRTGGDKVSGKLNADGTVWRSTWALNVSQHYTVRATAAGTSGSPITRQSSFRTFTPASTFTTHIVEGYHQTYGVGMPIILYFDRPIGDKTAVERALEIKTSKRVTGAWYWDSPCNMAPACLYFRPRHYWPTHTRVSFAGHLNGVAAAPGVYGDHTLTQSFTIGRSLTVTVNTASHQMDVYRDGKRFANWPISSGRPGDNTPNGQYLTIEKANPVEMKGPGYDIEVPFSVRFTWSGDYLHDAYWSVGEQGFTNVSHGCVNMSPADAETYYNMAVPGDPVKIVGSPRAGVWDNGWTMWFLSWGQWLRGSALHEAVQTGPQGSTFVSARSFGHHSSGHRGSGQGAQHR